MGRLISIAIIAAAAYWYWSGPYQQGRNPSAEEQLQANESAMRKCIRQEQSMGGAAGLAGVATDIGDPEQLCAEKLQLRRENDQWVAR